MKLLDTNILIYSAQEPYAFLRHLIDPSHAVSAFSMLEVLGYPSLKPIDHSYFEAAFQILQVIPISQSIIDEAITLKRQKKMSAGDAIIAATARVQGLELQTRNLRDFIHIQGLSLANPVD